MSRTRQAAGLGRQRLRVVVPSSLPEALAVTIASLLRSAAETAEMDPAHAPGGLPRDHQPQRAGEHDRHPRAAPDGAGHIRRLDQGATHPGFTFTDPPFRHSLPMALAFAAAGDRPAAVLTGPTVPAGTAPWPVRHQPPACGDMAPVRIQDHLLTATAALVWSGDLPRPLQQILFDTAYGVTSPLPACYAEPVPVSA